MNVAAADGSADRAEARDLPRLLAELRTRREARGKLDRQATAKHCGPLHFRGIVLGPSGFAAEGREWLQALEDAGLAPSLEGARLGDRDCELNPKQRKLIANCAARSKQAGGTTVHQMLVSHFVPDPEAERNVLITIFETESLPAGCAEQLNKADSIFLRTEWNRRAFISAGVQPEKIVVIPPPFDSSPFPGRVQRDEHASRPFRWLSIFDWTLRKGHDLLLDAFARTFEAGEAELWIKTNPQEETTPSLQAHCEQRIRAAGKSDPPAVRVIDSLLTQSELRQLYVDADAFVLPSRGEGWGRPVQEAMLMELPVLVTGATALDTLVPDEGLGYRLRAQRVPVSSAAAAETPCFANQHWFEVDPEELGSRMRELTANPVTAACKARRARNYVLDLCDRRRIAGELATQLS